MVQGAIRRGPERSRMAETECVLVTTEFPAWCLGPGRPQNVSLESPKEGSSSSLGGGRGDKIKASMAHLYPQSLGMFVSVARDTFAGGVNAKGPEMVSLSCTVPKTWSR